MHTQYLHTNIPTCSCISVSLHIYLHANIHTFLVYVLLTTFSSSPLGWGWGSSFSGCYMLQIQSASFLMTCLNLFLVTSNVFSISPLSPCLVQLSVLYCHYLLYFYVWVSVCVFIEATSTGIYILDGHKYWHWKPCKKLLKMTWISADAS